MNKPNPSGTGRDPKRAANGQFALDPHPEATVDLPHTGPTAEDAAQLAALYRDARIASEAMARFELGSAKMLAQGVLRQWPDARYLELTESDQGTGSHFPGAVLASSDPENKLADLEDEEMVNGANPEDLAMNLQAGGAWEEHTIAHPRDSGRVLLDVKAAASIGEEPAKISAAQQGTNEIGAAMAPGWSAAAWNETTVHLHDSEQDFSIEPEDGGTSYLLSVDGSDQQERYSSWVAAAHGAGAGSPDGVDQSAIIKPRYRHVDPATGREVNLLTTTKASSGRGSHTPVTGWYYADDDEPMAGSKPWTGSPNEGQLDLAVRRVTNGSELQAQAQHGESLSESDSHDVIL